MVLETIRAKGPDPVTIMSAELRFERVRKGAKALHNITILDHGVYGAEYAAVGRSFF